MSILVFIDQSEGQVSKSSYEAMSYGAALATQMGTTADGIILGEAKDDLASLGAYGLKKIHTVADASLNTMDAQVFANVLSQAANGYDVIIFSNNSTAKAVAPRLSVRLKAGLVAGAVALPETSNGFIVKKSVFSGKAFAHIKVESAVKIISLNVNAFSVSKAEGAAEVVAASVEVPAAKVKVVSVDKVKGEISLSEADTVVSGGRGLKGPEKLGHDRRTGRIARSSHSLQPARWQM